MSTFPELRWGSENSKLRRPMLWFASTHPGSWVIRSLTPFDRYVIQRSHGRYTALGPLGAPIMLLTTMGAVSSQRRTTPLLFARVGDDILIAGSNFGQAHHPAWSKNLLVHPDAIATVGGKDVPVTAKLLSGDEALAGFEKMIEVVPVYAEYKNRTDRAIRVFRLRAQSSA